MALRRDVKVGGSLIVAGVRITFEAKKGQVIRMAIQAPDGVRVQFHDIGEGFGDPRPEPFPSDRIGERDRLSYTPRS